jgi:hypothetical protein
VRRETPRSDLGAERLEDLGGVAVGLDVVPSPLDVTLLVDQEGRAQHPDAGLENDWNYGEDSTRMRVARMVWSGT